MRKPNIPEPDRIVRFPEVEHLAGVHRITLLDWVKKGEFPAPFKLSNSGAAIGWRLSTLMAWLDERAAGARQSR
ncbi:MAG TPA: AlpA family phage regulatory protein [Candidatus Binatus sp.]|uniref:helix-turn-helix transcriptional regulator n=1 Tax=Candidatus Binatus sp. TaxID=2811406 RepID=UPI002B484DA7|nr:AlpA family phage regulatory protein [Candidatus Binatus sp.]HKN13406.1 AlpA family phage regulatory protein [Candidatus Binatus sp.]